MKSKENQGLLTVTVFSPQKPDLSSIKYLWGDVRIKKAKTPVSSLSVLFGALLTSPCQVDTCRGVLDLNIFNVRVYTWVILGIFHYLYLPFKEILKEVALPSCYQDHHLFNTQKYYISNAQEFWPEPYVELFIVCIKKYFCCIFIFFWYYNLHWLNYLFRKTQF